MFGSEISHVPNIAVDHNPAIFRSVVLGDFVHGEQLFFGHDVLEGGERKEKPIKRSHLPFQASYSGHVP